MRKIIFIIITLVSLMMFISGCTSPDTESTTAPENSVEEEVKITTCKQLLTFQEVAEVCAITLPPSTLYDGASISGFIDPEGRSKCEFNAMVPEGNRDYAVAKIYSNVGVPYDTAREKDLNQPDFQEIPGIGKRAYQFTSTDKGSGAMLRILMFEPNYNLDEADDGVLKVPWQINSKPWEMEPIIDPQVNWQTWQSCNFEEMQKIAKKIESRVLLIYKSSGE